MKIRQLFFFVSSLILVIVIAGCVHKQEGAENPPVVEPSQTAVHLEPTVQLPTASPVPLITLVAQYTPTPRLITPAPAEGTFRDQSILSPDGKWTALPAFETLSSGYRVSLTISNHDKSTVWTPVDYQGDGLGYVFPKPKRWSADSRYFYYSESTVADGCGDFYPLETFWQRIDVQSGQVDKIALPPGRGHMFSPDESTLAYIPENAPAEIVLQDLTTQEETSVPLPVTAEVGQIPQAGGLLWSPAGDQIILAAANGTICEAKKLEFYLISIRFAELKAEILYRGDDFIRPLAWDPGGKVRVMDWDSKSWWIDAATGAITTAP